MLLNNSVGHGQPQAGHRPDQEADPQAPVGEEKPPPGAQETGQALPQEQGQRQQGRQNIRNQLAPGQGKEDQDRGGPEEQSVKGKIVLLVVIILALGGAGLVLYRSVSAARSAT